MTGVDRAADTPPGLLAHATHLARLLFAETPAEAERNAAALLAPRPVIEGDRAVWRLDTSQHTYIVYENGTLTTRRERPPWARDDVQTIEVDQEREVVHEEFVATCQALRAADEGLWAAAGLDETERAVASARVGYQMHAPWGVHAGDVPTLLGDPGAAAGWAARCTRAMLDAHLRLRMAGDTAATAIAALTLLEHGSDPDRMLAVALMHGLPGKWEIGESFDPRERAEPLCERMTKLVGARGTCAPLLEAPLLALDLQAAGRDGLLQVSGVADWLIAQGRDLVQFARRALSIELFYIRLHRALVYFKAADGVLEFLDRLYGSTPHPQLDAQRVLCEERRVVIVCSLWHAAAVGTDMNPTSFPSLFHWIDELAATLPLEAAEDHVDNAALQLVIPGFVRDLALGWLYLRRGHLKDASEQLTSVIARLERDLQENPPVPFEPGYLIPAREALAGLAAIG
jgi:hypothetical protein